MVRTEREPSTPRPIAGEPTAPRPKVVMVGPFPPTKGGVTTFMLNVLNSSLAERYRFVPFTVSRPPKKNVVSNWGYASLLRGGVLRIFSGALLTIWHFILFPFTLVLRRIDLVQLQASDFQAFWEAACYLFVARLFRRPVLMRIGGAFDRFYDSSSPRARRMIARVINKPDLLIVQSLYWRDFVNKLGRAEDVLVLNNFVGEDIISEHERRPREVPLFLFFAGNEAERKGVNELLEAIKIVKSGGVRVGYVFLGVAPVLRKRIELEGLDGDVESREYVTRDEVLREMRRCDAFLLPSHGEGFPNALLEAMASGLPSVVTPVGAVPEVVADGDCGLIVAAGDAAALAARIARLASDADLRAAMGKRAVEVVRERFTDRVVLVRLDEAYRRLGCPRAS